MKTNKTVVVALAAAILASGGSIAGSVVTATPAHANAVIEPQLPSAPTGVKVIPKSGWFQPTMNVVWNAPTGGFGTTITGYTVTLKQAGKADRVFTSKTTSVSVNGFTENTSYTVQVAANVTATQIITGTNNTIHPTSISTTTAPAIASIRTGYSNYAPTSVQVSVPKISVMGVTENSIVTKLSTPGFTVGQISNYVVTVKQGTTVVKTATVTNPADNPTGSRAIPYTVSGLKSNTAYTIEVKTNVKAWSGTKTATSTVTSAKFVTAKSSAVAVAKPAVTVSSVASKTATVTWKKPAVTGSIRTYLIFATEKGSQQSMRLGEYSPTSTSAVLPSVLKPNTTYTVSVIAMAVSEDGRNTAQAVTNVDFTTKR
jgi:hypothetical protein